MEGRKLVPRIIAIVFWVCSAYYLNVFLQLGLDHYFEKLFILIGAVSLIGGLSYMGWCMWCFDPTPSSGEKMD